MSIDKYLDREYDLKTYNCGHFVADVWLDLFGEDIHEYICALYAPKVDRHVKLATLRIFKLETNIQKYGRYIVLFHGSNGMLHVGIHYKGRILHITESGVKFELIETILAVYKKASYYHVKTMDR